MHHGAPSAIHERLRADALLFAKEEGEERHEADKTHEARRRRARRGPWRGAQERREERQSAVGEAHPAHLL